MAKPFKLPDIGEGLTEAEVVRWLVPVGGEVKVDQPVVEVETDKAVVEIPSPYAGIVIHHGATEGEVLAVGDVLVVVGEPGESWPESSGTGPPPEAAPIVGTISSEAVTLEAAGSAVPGTSGPVMALPVVRKLARDLGVDLEQVAGSGPGGRITREDVMQAAESKTVEPQMPETPTPPVSEPMVTTTESASTPLDEAQTGVEQETDSIPDTPPAIRIETPAATPLEEPAPGGGTGRKLSRLRRTIADNMVRSWNEIPHVTTFDEVDASRLLAAKRALSERHGTAVSLDALAVKAVIPALRAHPDVYSRLTGDELVTPERIDIGVAVDTDEGLMVVVVRDAPSFGLIDLSEEIRRLAERAKARQATPDELTGQSFTVSNIGAVGGGFGTPIVPPGTVAILSVGKAIEKPIAAHGAVEIAPMLPLSLSYDHRVIDGGAGRRFMATVIENLEEPALFLA